MSRFLAACRSAWRWAAIGARPARIGACAAALALGAAPAAAQEGGRVVRQLRFEGNRSIDRAVLAASIRTTSSSWFATTPLVRWLGLGEKRYLDETEFQRDVLRLEVLYKRSGFPEARVDTLVRRTDRDAFVTFRIHEGPPIRVASLRLLGLDSLPPEVRAAVVQDLPLRVGRPFNRALLQVTVDTVAGRLRDRGYPAADVFREFTADSATRSAEVALTVETGPRMRVGTVRVEGVARVDTQVVRSLMVTRPGRPYAEKEVFASQLNLYRADLFSTASVQLDSAAFERTGATVPLVVRVAEAPPRRAAAGLGYGTNDCFRSRVGWAVRNFGGGGRILDLSARVSKVGFAQGLDWGLRDNICSALKDDSIGSRALNYNVTASVRRPAFLSPQNAVSFAVFAERRSEFAAFLREDIGAGISLTRESKVQRDPVTLSYTFSYGRTEATPVAFCAYFSVCTEDVRSLQAQRRPVATLGLVGRRPRVNALVDPSRGSILSGEVTWSSTLIGSASFQQFTRLVGEGRWYRTLATDVVLSGRIRGGIVVAPSLQEGQAPNFVPLEQRFYAGGPNDVRGYGANQLGPVVYVIGRAAFDSIGTDPDRLAAAARPAATGGDALALANLELRVPAPVFPSRLRLAAFVDAGSVWQRGGAAAPTTVRVTPGVGLRVATPLGPFRLDVAWNPYPLEKGLLYVAEPNGDLTPQPALGLLQAQRGGRFQFHITVGQAF